MQGIQWNLLNTNAPAQAGMGIVNGFQGGVESGQKMYINQLAIRQAQEQEMQQRELQNALMQTGGDMGKVIPQVMMRNPKLGMELQKGQSEQMTAEIEREIKLQTVRQNASNTIATAPEGMVLQTAFDTLQRTSQLTGATQEQIAQAQERLQMVFDTKGENGLRREASLQTLQAKDRLSKISFQDAGDRIIPVEENPYAEGFNPQPIQKGMAPGKQQELKLQQQRLNKEAKEEDPLEIKRLAAGIANYTVPPMSSFAMARPQGILVMEEVMKINPDYDATTYGAKADAAKKFGAGTLGNQMRSFKTAVEHIGQLKELSTALNNGQLPVINAIANKVSTWTGGTAPTNFEATKDIVSKEITKAIVINGGGVEERREAAQLLKDAKTPEQLAGMMDQYLYLMEAQYQNLEAQRAATGLPESTSPNYNAGSGQGGDIIEPQPLPVPQQAQPMAIKSDAEYDALPSGAVFIAPDGSTRRKP